MPNTRITVALLPRVAAELAELADGSGMSKADIINRAITLYRFVVQKDRLDQETELLVRTGDVVERIKLL